MNHDDPYGNLDFDKGQEEDSMTCLHLLSGTTCGPDFLIPDNWFADRAFAVVELIDALRKRIRMHYHSHCVNSCTNNAPLP